MLFYLIILCIKYIKNKMSLKDWKKHGGSDNWVRENPKEVVNVSEVSGTWDVAVDTLRGRKHLKVFKTKPEAIAFARSYMRSH